MVMLPAVLVCAIVAAKVDGPVAMAELVVQDAELAPMAGEVSAALLDGYRQLEIHRVAATPLPACEGADCLRVQARNAGAKYLVTARLSAHGADMVLELDLLPVEDGAPRTATSNSAPRELGATALESVALLEQLLLPRETNESLAVPMRESTDGRPPLPARPADAPCMSPSDWRRYSIYRQRTRDPLSPSAWVEHQNRDSGFVNALWITPPALLLGGAVTGAAGLAVVGAVLLPVAVVAAILDAADVGEVRPCEDASR